MAAACVATSQPPKWLLLTLLILAYSATQGAAVGNRTHTLSTRSKSKSESLSFSCSFSFSHTVTPPPTPSRTLSFTKSPTASISHSESLSASESESLSLSCTSSISHTVTPPPTPTRTLSFTKSVNLTHSPTQTKTLSTTCTSSISHTVTPPPTPTPSLTTGTRKLPKTESLVPSPSASLAFTASATPRISVRLVKFPPFTPLRRFGTGFAVFVISTRASSQAAEHALRRKLAPLETFSVILTFRPTPYFEWSVPSVTVLVPAGDEANVSVLVRGLNVSANSNLDLRDYVTVSTGGGATLPLSAPIVNISVIEPIPVEWFPPSFVVVGARGAVAVRIALGAPAKPDRPLALTLNSSSANGAITAAPMPLVFSSDNASLTAWLTLDVGTSLVVGSVVRASLQAEFGGDLFTLPSEAAFDVRARESVVLAPSSAAQLRVALSAAPPYPNTTLLVQVFNATDGTQLGQASFQHGDADLAASISLGTLSTAQLTWRLAGSAAPCYDIDDQSNANAIKGIPAQGIKRCDSQFALALAPPLLILAAWVALHMYLLCVRADGPPPIPPTATHLGISKLRAWAARHAHVAAFRPCHWRCAVVHAAELLLHVCVTLFLLALGLRFIDVSPWAVAFVAPAIAACIRALTMRLSWYARHTVVESHSNDLEGIASDEAAVKPTQQHPSRIIVIPFNSSMPKSSGEDSTAKKFDTTVVMQPLPLLLVVGAHIVLALALMLAAALGPLAVASQLQRVTCADFWWVLLATLLLFDALVWQSIASFVFLLVLLRRDPEAKDSTLTLHAYPGELRTVERTAVEMDSKEMTAE